MHTHADLPARKAAATPRGTHANKTALFSTGAQAVQPMRPALRDAQG